MTSKPPPFSPSKLFKDDHDPYPANVMLKAQLLPIKSIKDRQSISASSDCSLFQQIKYFQSICHTILHQSHHNNGHIYMY